MIQDSSKSLQKGFVTYLIAGHLNVLLIACGNSETQLKDSRVGGPESERTSEEGVMIHFYLELDALDQAPRILVNDCIPWNGTGEYFSGEHLIGDFLVDNRYVSRGRTRYVGCGYETALSIAHDQGKDLGIGKHDNPFPRDVSGH